MPPAVRCQLLSCLLVAACVGCSVDSLPQQLEGRWVGKPDSFADREARTPSVLSTLSPSAAADGAKDAPATELERYQFEVMLDLRADGELAMALNQGGVDRQLAGTWQVISRVGNTATLELTQAASADSDTVQRRFTLTLEPGGDGFTLREEGAEREFGWLYFRREGGA